MTRVKSRVTKWKPNSHFATVGVYLSLLTNTISKFLVFTSTERSSNNIMISLSVYIINMRHFTWVRTYTSSTTMELFEPTEMSSVNILLTTTSLLIFVIEQFSWLKSTPIITKYIRIWNLTLYSYSLNYNHKNLTRWL